MAGDLTSESKLWHIWVLCQQRNLQHASPSQWMHSGMQTRQNGVMRGKSLNSHKLLRNAIHSQTAHHNNKLLKAYLAADMTGVLWWLRTAGGWCLSSERVRKRRWKKKKGRWFSGTGRWGRFWSWEWGRDGWEGSQARMRPTLGQHCRDKSTVILRRGDLGLRGDFSVTFSFSGFLKIRS